MPTTRTTDTTTTNLSGALEQALPELMEMPAESLRPINLDITTAAVTVLGAMPALRERRPEIAAQLGEEHAAPIDKVELFTQAALQANANHNVSVAPARVQALSAEVVDKREVLYAEAIVQVKRKHLAPDALADLRGVVGFANQAHDLVQLIAAFRTNWATLEPVTHVTIAELDEAEQLAKRFLLALGEREQGPMSTSVSADVQKRAYTKFVDTWDLVRRAIVFLRWGKGDADTLAPSLWAGRGGRKARTAGDGEDPVIDDGEPQSPVGPVPNNGGAPFTA
jgi:hypothetical protein